MKSDPVSAVADALRAADTVLVSVHVNPDGDALGSQLALRLALLKWGKEVVVHNLDSVPEIYRFLPGSDRITTGPALAGSFDAMVVLDTEPSRTGLFAGTYPARTLINIDHHVTNPREWPLLWLEPDAAATGEMVYTLIRRMGIPIDRDIALCLYTAVFTDTGSFRYTNTTPAVMRIAADLLEAGADPWLVTENVYESSSFRRMRLLGLVLAGIETTADGGIAWVAITQEMYRATGTGPEDTENFVNFVRSVRGVEVAVLMRQVAELQYKISFRSKGRVDLSGLAKSLGGGGHKNAAGCTLAGTRDEVRARVVAAVEEVIRTQRTGR